VKATGMPKMLDNALFKLKLESNLNFGAMLTRRSPVFQLPIIPAILSRGSYLDSNEEIYRHQANIDIHLRFLTAIRVIQTA